MTTTTNELPASTLVKKQTKSYGPRKCGSGYLVAEVRHDDECSNGHNSFAITGELYEPQVQRGEPKITVAGKTYWLNGCGCLHDEIAATFPELAPFIKWHLTSADEPMHYVANTVYHASDRDHNGRLKGERYHVLGHEEKRVIFGDFPISFEFDSRFVKWLEGRTSFDLEVIPVEHPPDTYKFGPKFTIGDFECQWYQCPFDRAEEALEFLEACQKYPPRIVIFQDKFTRVGEGKERDLNAARSCAVWPEATDAELCLERPELTAKLLERLPALMQEFKAAVESLEFTY